jgi:hypothetical protein
MTLCGLQRLLMILGSKVAADFRVIVEGIFTRYMAGDTSMIEEIARSLFCSYSPGVPPVAGAGACAGRHWY